MFLMSACIRPVTSPRLQRLIVQAHNLGNLLSGKVLNRFGVGQHWKRADLTTKAWPRASSFRQTLLLARRYRHTA